MGLTEKQIYDLNNMNVAAQNIHLGDLLNNLIENSGGTEKFAKVIAKESHLAFPNVGDINNIYIATNENEIYRWDDKYKKYYKISYNYNEITTIVGGDANG